jgi:hypothetical protein
MKITITIEDQDGAPDVQVEFYNAQRKFPNTALLNFDPHYTSVDYEFWNPHTNPSSFMHSDVTMNFVALPRANDKVAFTWRILKEQSDGPR